MPLTPFIGLSVLIHLAVITVNKLFTWTSKPENLLKVNKKTKRFFAFVIITFVFGFISLNAAVLIGVSVADKHSSLRFIDNYFFSRDGTTAVASVIPAIYDAVEYPVAALCK